MVKAMRTDKESNEPNYDEGSRETNNTAMTTNEVF
jgi:hypothetical protein